MTPDLDQFNADWHSMKVVKYDENSERETIEEDRWSYKKDCHYTVPIGEYDTMSAKATLEGYITILPSVIEAYDCKNAREVIESEIKDGDMPNNLYHKIKNWDDLKATYNIKKFGIFDVYIYNIVIEV